MRFHSICEFCKSPSEEYSSFPTCGECLRETCEACAEIYEIDYDCVGDPARYVFCGTVLCKRCADEA